MPTEELELRNVSADDMDDLYSWRNHPVVRENSFSIEPLSLEGYRRWFKRKAQSVDTVIYVGYCRDCKIGTIRFEEEPENIKVSVMLNPEYIGKGLGTKCIKEGVRRFMEENRSRKPIMAEIKKDNFASIKAFEKAGFVKDEKNKRRDCLIYFFDSMRKDLWKK